MNAIAFSIAGIAPVVHHFHGVTVHPVLARFAHDDRTEQGERSEADNNGCNYFNVEHLRNSELQCSE